MIISRTPFRISFFGGGTDYPVWYHEHGGAVLATTIDKYCYISCRYLPPFFAHKSRVVYSKVEYVKSRSEIEHPAIRGALEYLQIDDGLEIHHDGDLPAKTGLGSSSAFTVGLLHALYGLQGMMPSKLQLAREAIAIEQHILNESVGCQDQVLAAYGGFNRIDFSVTGEFRVSPVPFTSERRNALQDHLMLFFTGISRIASQIAKSQIEAMKDRARELHLMHQQVDEALEILQGSADLSAFGELLHEAWQCKRNLTDQISNPQIDGLYARARAAGAIGGKLLGAGGGGFFLLFVKPEEQDAVRAALPEFLYVPVRFKNAGSQIIFYDPDGVSPIPREGVPPVTVTAEG